MTLKIDVGRLMPMEKILDQIKAEKEAHEKSVAKRKELCSALGLNAQVKMCDYQLDSGKFYRPFAKSELDAISDLRQRIWGKNDFSNFDRSVIPDGVLEELAFLQQHQLFSEHTFSMLCEELGFLAIGESSNQSDQRFLIARWGESDKMKSFREMETIANLKRDAGKQKEEEALQKTFKEKVIAKVPLPPAVEKWARDFHRLNTTDKIIITGKCLFSRHCKSRMYYIKRSGMYTTECVCECICGECGFRKLDGTDRW